MNAKLQAKIDRYTDAKKHLMAAKSALPASSDFRDTIDDMCTDINNIIQDLKDDADDDD